MDKSKKKLDYSIVAFVDILGFSEMVKSDCEQSVDAPQYFDILRLLNRETRDISACNVTQFSDSVIFSLPLSNENYIKMIELLAEYQLKLFLHSIICRGAVAYGKHYVENEFVFSQALIEAYQLESKSAIYPRIILSDNLIEYFKPSMPVPQHTIKEKDGYYFVDYFANADIEETEKQLSSFNSSLVKFDKSVKEKYYWLFDYWEYKFEKKLSFSSNRFLQS